MQTNSWHHEFSAFIFHFHLKNEKSFLDEIKSIFHSFWRAFIWGKNKKIRDANFMFHCPKNCSFLRIWSHLLKKSLMENFIFCAMYWADYWESNHTVHSVWRVWRQQDVIFPSEEETISILPDSRQNIPKDVADNAQFKTIQPLAAVWDQDNGEG